VTKKNVFFNVDPQTEENRDCSRALPDRAANQDLVPEPPDEVEEGAQDGVDERDAHAPDASGVSLPGAVLIKSFFLRHRQRGNISKSV
jgi:hypothetical protein